MENIKHILIRNAIVIDCQSKYNNQTKDVLITDGIIEEISNKINIDSPFLEIKIPNLHISPGWIDLHCNLCEPGYEHRENIKTGLKSAAKGGFTSVVTRPNTNPPIDNKADLQFLINRSINNIVDIYPTGCITKNLEGKKITEMYDMFINGAVAFSDGKRSIENPMIMNIALDYVKNFNGLIMATAMDENLNKSSQIHEGRISTLTGLKPSPEIAEDIRVSRDLAILKYTNSRLHLSTLSTSNSIKSIKIAKQKKLSISADVAAHQIILSDEDLINFNSNYKVNPPLRDKKTQKALIKSLIDGTIDAVSSDHSPVENDLKKCAFQDSEPGIIGLQTVFPIINTVLKKHMEINNIIKLISTNPRNILKIDSPVIKEQEKANITLFDPNKKWTFTKNHIESISQNTPFINYEFTGKVWGVINKGMVTTNN